MITIDEDHYGNETVNITCDHPGCEFPKYVGTVRLMLPGNLQEAYYIARANGWLVRERTMREGREVYLEMCPGHKYKIHGA